MYSSLVYLSHHGWVLHSSGSGNGSSSECPLSGIYILLPNKLVLQFLPVIFYKHSFWFQFNVEWQFVVSWVIYIVWSSQIQIWVDIIMHKKKKKKRVNLLGLLSMQIKILQLSKKLQLSAIHVLVNMHLALLLQLLPSR